jgi:hypothetical protein
LKLGACGSGRVLSHALFSLFFLDARDELVMLNQGTHALLFSRRAERTERPEQVLADGAGVQKKHCNLLPNQSGMTV